MSSISMRCRFVRPACSSRASRTKKQDYLDLWKTLNPDPTDKEIIRNYPIRQPLLWV